MQGVSNIVQLANIIPCGSEQELSVYIRKEIKEIHVDVLVSIFPVTAKGLLKIH